MTRKGNHILKFNLPIGVQKMTLKSIDIRVCTGFKLVQLTNNQ